MLVGFSGCSVLKQGKIVVKTATNYSPERLIAQAHKQKSFQSGCGRIQVPAVHEIGPNWFTMDYCGAYNLFNYLDIVSPSELKALCITLHEYLTPGGPPQDIQPAIARKLADLAPKLESPAYIPSCATPLYCPLQACHGDLTMSNILFGWNMETVYFIDFLDSFIESRIVDLAKIRQSTKFHWEYVSNAVGLPIRHAVCLDYIDKYLVDNVVPLYQADTYKVVEIVNYLRIMPYANSQIRSYLNGVLECLV